MAIRDRFRRALRQSNSSDSISQSDSNSSSASSTHRTSSSEAPSPISLIKTVSSTASLSSSFRLTKTFSFRGSRDKSKASKEAAGKINTAVPKLHDELPSRPRGKSRPLKPTKAYLHPSQRPLTEQNLQHQEMLRHFTMTFGATNLAQIEELDDCGISPCCTRACSIAGDLS